MKLLLWTLGALAGVVLAAGVTYAASSLSTQRIGISSEPVSAGRELAPRPTAAPTRTATPRPKPRKKRRPAPTATPRPTATAVPTAAPTVDDHGGGSDDHGGRGGGHGSDD
jgi:hypothetical protein